MANTVEHPLFIGLVGETATGKSAVARYIDSLSLDHLDPRLVDRFRQVQAIRTRSMLQVAGYTGGFNDGAAMREYHRNLRATGDSERVFTKWHQIMTGDVVVIDAIRHPMDAQTILDLGGFLCGLDVTGKYDELELQKRWIMDHENLGTQVDEKHQTQTWAEACLEVYGDPSDPYASDIRAAFDMVPVENRIDSIQALPDMLEDMRDLVTRLALRHIGLEPVKLVNV